MKGLGTFQHNLYAGHPRDTRCEVSPLVSYEGEDLTGHFLASEVTLPLHVASKMEFADNVHALTFQKTKGSSFHYLEQSCQLAQDENKFADETVRREAELVSLLASKDDAT